MQTILKWTPGFLTLMLLVHPSATDAAEKTLRYRVFGKTIGSATVSVAPTAIRNGGGILVGCDVGLRLEVLGKQLVRERLTLFRVPMPANGKRVIAKRKVAKFFELGATVATHFNSVEVQVDGTVKIKGKRLRIPLVRQTVPVEE